MASRLSLSQFCWDRRMALPSSASMSGWYALSVMPMMTSTVSSMSDEVLEKLKEYDSPLSSLSVVLSHSSPESDQITSSDESLRTRLWV